MNIEDRLYDNGYCPCEICFDDNIIELMLFYARQIDLKVKELHEASN